MIFVIGVITYIVGHFVLGFCDHPRKVTIGAAIGAALMIAGVAMALISFLMLAWSYLP